MIDEINTSPSGIRSHERTKKQISEPDETVVFRDKRRIVDCDDQSVHRAERRREHENSIGTRLNSVPETSFETGHLKRHRNFPFRPNLEACDQSPDRPQICLLDGCSNFNSGRSFSFDFCQTKMLRTGPFHSAILLENERHGPWSHYVQHGALTA
jgi:hypothetical protein